MTPKQRRIHLLIWLAIGPVVGLLFVLGLLWRPAVPVQPGAAPGATATEDGGLHDER